VRRAMYGDSEYDEFEDVESKGRWENCLGVDAKR